MLLSNFLAQRLAWWLAKESVGFMARGRMTAVLFGMFLGAAAGSLLGLLGLYLIPVGMALGGPLGGLIAAAAFPSPPIKVPEDMQIEPGDFVFSRFWEIDEEANLVVVMDNAFYLGVGKPTDPWQEEVDQLGDGQRTAKWAMRAMPFSVIEYLQCEDNDKLVVMYRRGSSMAGKVLEFANEEQRTTAMAQIETFLGRPLHPRDRPKPLVDVVALPLGLWSIVAVLFACLAMIRAAMSTGPAGGIYAAPSQVGSFIKLGTSGIAVIGVLASVPFFLWALVRLSGRGLVTIYPVHGDLDQ